LSDRLAPTVVIAESALAELADYAERQRSIGRSIRCLTVGRTGDREQLCGSGS
jgi:hypothetical protein